MKKTILIFLCFCAFQMNAQVDSFKISKSEFLELVNKVPAVEPFVMQYVPSWFEADLSVDTIIFKNKSVAFGEMGWIVKQSKMEPTYLRLNDRKFRFTLDRIRNDTLSELVIKIKPRVKKE